MNNSNHQLDHGALESMRRASPALERYTEDVLLGELWTRPQLSVRDRSIITLSVLIARNQSEHMPFYLDVALDHGVQPSEISGVIAHLAFYSGWANAMAAAKVVQPVFEKLGVDAVPPSLADAGLLPVDLVAEEWRHAVVQRKFGEVAPRLVELTKDVLFDDLWRQPELSVRDRCLVTICSVIATAQTAQLAFYVNRALDNGVTRSDLSELMTHVAFYAGWSSAYTALAVVKDVFESRPD